MAAKVDTARSDESKVVPQMDSRKWIAIVVGLVILLVSLVVPAPAGMKPAAEMPAGHPL